MSCDASNQQALNAMLKLAVRHENAEWREVGEGTRLLILPLADLEADPATELFWKSARPDKVLGVQIASGQIEAHLLPNQPQSVTAIPGTFDAARGHDHIHFGGLYWTLVAPNQSVPGLDDLRSFKAPEATEVEDLDAREKWFKDRH
ncbi:hypothetical protein EBB79_07295 [Parasedimentitalea marina]|uniref:Uncharacterized protein n=1 Tax=Parasedimentitalea marina TaxID=2483033 RepID=A0A3T0N105_9RHOB|nr:hypothetical protein [Parasedimentitalea marina]AZV77713.1 hypothetical protein EBB79_07295 [Parasedimentitalea marina]